MSLEAIHNFIFDFNVFDHYAITYSIIPYSIAASYVVFCKYLGPSLMRERKPLPMRPVMFGFNLFLSTLNLYLALTGTSLLYKFFHMSCRLKENPYYETFKTQAQLFGWHLYLAKFFELFDTVIFVLRKKQNQISFLHVFHHAAVFITMWVVMRIKIVGYYIVILITINCYIHVVMYFYYFLSAFGPQMQKYLWWKRYLTKLQMAQFLFTMIYLAHGFLTGCEDMDALEISIFILMVAFFALFFNFYLQTFLKNRRRKE